MKKIFILAVLLAAALMLPASIAAKEQCACSAEMQAKMQVMENALADMKVLCTGSVSGTIAASTSDTEYAKTCHGKCDAIFTECTKPCNGILEGCAVAESCRTENNKCALNCDEANQASWDALPCAEQCEKQYTNCKKECRNNGDESYRTICPDKKCVPARAECLFSCPEPLSGTNAPASTAPSDEYALNVGDSVTACGKTVKLERIESDLTSVGVWVNSEFGVVTKTGMLNGISISVDSVQSRAIPEESSAVLKLKCTPILTASMPKPSLWKRIFTGGFFWGR